MTASDAEKARMSCFRRGRWLFPGLREGFQKGSEVHDVQRSEAPRVSKVSLRDRKETLRSAVRIVAGINRTHRAGRSRREGTLRYYQNRRADSLQERVAEGK